jgi:D-alanyl-D-alanine carboxypeptidase/Bacterial SH3 domain
MAETTPRLRTLWKTYDCSEKKMVVVPFGPDKIRIAPPTVAAWDALASVLDHHRYDLRSADTDSYNCRNIKGSNLRSLHAYGIALDVNWNTNPFKRTPDKRKVRFSSKATQGERAEAVRLGEADTDMTPAMIADVLAIKTRRGKQVFDWGGSWSTTKDSMHFEIDLSPADLAAGIDPRTVAGGLAGSPAAELHPAVSPAPWVPAAPAEPYVVIARDGLKLRAGPSVSFAAIRTYPEGTQVTVLSRDRSWGLVDLQSDGKADGYMHLGFLRPVHAADGDTPTTQPAGAPSPAPGDILDRVTVEIAAGMFPRTRKAPITANLPFVLAGLRARALGDRVMVLMALGTIRAETEGFVPISEGISRFNTARPPFDLYDAGTAIGRRLGNTRPGDGARFKGRGFVQLTGRDNYARLGPQIDRDLAGNPELANDPKVAGLILAQFLKNKEGAIRRALASDALRLARRLVNGGSHGADRFEDAYLRGARLLPA